MGKVVVIYELKYVKEMVNCMVSLFINKLVCFFWKKYCSSGLGYRNFVVVWFIYIFYLYKYGF